VQERVHGPGEGKKSGGSFGASKPQARHGELHHCAGGSITKIDNA
tara:strand:+ start:312 stop:446 length:135 start_codon:yes stop_codon:yes gene_type:complete